MSLTLQEDPGKDYSINDIQELKKLLARIKSVEEQSIGLINRLEKK